MIRKSIVTGKPLFNHPEKDGFANDVFLNMTNDVADYTKRIKIATDELGVLNNDLVGIKQRLYEWDLLLAKPYKPSIGKSQPNMCGRKKGCTSDDKNSRNHAKINVDKQLALIDEKNNELRDLRKGLETASKVETDPVLKKIATEQAKDVSSAEIEAKKNTEEINLKKTRTKWIAGIGLAVVLIGGIFFIIRAKRKKA